MGDWTVQVVAMSLIDVALHCDLVISILGVEGSEESFGSSTNIAHCATLVVTIVPRTKVTAAHAAATIRNRAVTFSHLEAAIACTTSWS